MGLYRWIPEMTITLDPGWIFDVSMGTYSVGDIAGTISNDRFSRFLTIIESRLTVDNLLNTDGSLKTGTEYLAALLICDLITNGKVTNYGVVSENFGGDYSYSKSALTARTTKTNFLVRYEEELTIRRKGKSASNGAVRKDYQIEFAKLTQGNMPAVKNSSSDYPGLM
jgi:hypothetical protein